MGIVRSILLVACLGLCINCSAVEVYESATRAFEQSKGFDGVHSQILLSEDNRLPRNDNAISNILTELDSEAVSNRMEAAIHTEPGAFKFLAYRVSRDVYVMMAYKAKGLPERLADLTFKGYQAFASARLHGHSSEYALDLFQLMLQTNKPPLQGMSAEDEFSWNHIVPRNWLRRSSKDLRYYVVDGRYAWIYYLDDPRCVDAQELDPKLGPLIEKVLDDTPTDRGARNYYRQVQRILKQQHGIDWLSPLDLNPGLIIDFAQGKRQRSIRLP